MPRPSLDPLKYIADGVPSVVASVNGSYTGTTAGTILATSSTQRVRIKGWNLTCFVAGTLAGNETGGDYVIMYDAVVTAPIHVLGVLPTVDTLQGSILGTSAMGIGGTAFAPGATAWGTPGTRIPPDIQGIPLGYTATAAGNDILFGLVGSDDGALEDASTGIIRVVGTIWYDLV
jgi:hypothetical protein